jgi:ABC-type uncharacterized transport system ATPase subunit
MAAPALACRAIGVTYGSLKALDDVSVAFAPGQIHAVVGQNGAGKTTFARVVAGLVAPSAGGVEVNGKAVPPGNVAASRAEGVELVHQSFALPPSFTVAEALEFGFTGKGALYSRAQVQRRWQSHLSALDISVPPSARIRDLPVEAQQSVEIARALVTDAKILILDEPTAVLSPAGIEALFARVRRLKAQGVTILLILHKIREVLAIADTVTVLRGGKLVAGPLPAAEVTAPQLATLIVGEAAAPGGDVAAALGAGEVAHVAQQGLDARPKVAELSAVSTRPDPEGPALVDASLAIRAGEIVGVAGVEGNGQRTLVRAIAGLVETTGGTQVLAGTDTGRLALAERRRLGLRIIPFERNVEGLSLTSSLWENWVARQLVEGKLLSFIAPRAIRAACDKALKAWSVRYETSTQRAGSLSGGNAQKVILAREVDDDAKLIIAAQPTRGLDIGATAFVWQALRAAAARGSGVLVISSDLDELFDISDRIIVMLSGRIVAEFTAPYDLGAVGAAMTGAR